MKPRGLLISVAVLAVLGGLTYWSNKKEKADADKPPADAPPKILSIPEDQFKQIRLQKIGGEATLLARKDDGKWQITEPKPLNADQDSVGALVSTLASLSSDRLIEDKAADLAPYGLGNPSMQVAITRKDGKTDTLLLGDETPTGGSQFAKLESDPRIFTVSSYIKGSFDKSAEDLRDKRLLTFDPEKLTRVELQAKGQTIEFGKDSHGEWQILKPRPLRGDNMEIDELVRKLKDGKMESAAIPAVFASGLRVATVSISDSSGNQQLELRRGGDNNYYVKSSAVEGIYRVPGEFGDGLDKDLNVFRNKKLFDFGWNDPSKVEVRNGAQSASYQKTGEKWLSGQKEMDPATVQTLIDKLRDLTSIKFLESGGGNPVFEATVTSGDGKRLEKVTVTQEGNSFFAKRDGESSIYELDGKTVEELQKDASAIKEPAKK